MERVPGDDARAVVMSGDARRPIGNAKRQMKSGRPASREAMRGIFGAALGLDLDKLRPIPFITEGLAGLSEQLDCPDNLFPRVSIPRQDEGRGCAGHRRDAQQGQ